MSVSPIIKCPILGYLVQLDDPANVVIDTGYRPGTFGENEHLGQAFHALGEQLIVNQLARLGLQPSDIDYMINAHFDADHAGYMDAFPRAGIVVRRSHLAVARASEHPRLAMLLSRFYFTARVNAAPNPA